MACHRHLEFESIVQPSQSYKDEDEVVWVPKKPTQAAKSTAPPNKPNDFRLFDDFEYEYDRRFGFPGFPTSELLPSNVEMARQGPQPL